MQAVTIVGAGGHAKVVIATLRDLGREVAGVLDDDPSLLGRDTVLGLPYLGPIDGSRGLSGPAIAAIGDNATRARVVERLPDAHWIEVVHPSAHLDRSVRIGVGTFVAAGSIVQPDTLLGPHAILNTGSSVDHDCSIGGFAHVAPGARIAGGVMIGAGTLIGIGAACIPGASVGAWTVVGAGSAVTADLPDRVTAVGAPARIVRPSHPSS